MGKQNKPPTWLPNLVLLDDYDNDWTKYEKVLYKIFGKTLKSRKFTLYGKKVSYDVRRTYKGKEEIFEHLISEDFKPGQSQETTRVPDMRRCERLPWIRAITDNIDSKETKILVYDDIKRPGDIRTIIFLPDIEYVIILKKRKTTFVLISAYVPTEKRKREFQSKYDAANQK